MGKDFKTLWIVILALVGYLYVHKSIQIVHDLNDQINYMEYDYLNLQSELDLRYSEIDQILDTIHEYRSDNIMLADMYDTPRYDDPYLCAITAFANIAAYEYRPLYRRHWDYARMVAHVAETRSGNIDPCSMAYYLVSISRQESNWTPTAISNVGAIGMTQIRSCDTWDRMNTCCNEFTQGGHHCRPTSDWLFDPLNAMQWTADYLENHYNLHGRYIPQLYVGYGSAMDGYAFRHRIWMSVASGIIQ
jgi:hypothetical protein